MEDTSEAVHEAGHRIFVGGVPDHWDLIGELQFRFLVERGLTPADVLVDIGCGALRGGVRFIRFLDSGHYLGIDKHIELVVYGVALELGIDVYRQKRPRFVISDSFDFDRFGLKPRFAIAQSLFTHLASSDLERCLLRLRAATTSGCRMFASFREADEPAANPRLSNSHLPFAYTRSEMEAFARGTGWEARYIGEWGHPRGQKMMEYAAI